MESQRSREITITIILEFLKTYPHELNWRRKPKPDPNILGGQKKIIEYIDDYCNRIIRPTIPSTVPDPLVSVILEKFYGSELTEHDIVTEHQYCMGAENIIGSLLEAYIAKEAIEAGWVQCVGSIIRKVDFIKKDGTAWRLLQVKNRDNSENSSSQAIRNGTNIEKWFRSFSKTGKTNWDNFPDPLVKLTEQGFHTFVADYMVNLKSA